MGGGDTAGERYEHVAGSKWRKHQIDTIGGHHLQLGRSMQQVAVVRGAGSI